MPTKQPKFLQCSILWVDEANHQQVASSLLTELLRMTGVEIIWAEMLHPEPGFAMANDGTLTKKMSVELGRGNSSPFTLPTSAEASAGAALFVLHSSFFTLRSSLYFSFLSKNSAPNTRSATPMMRTNGFPSLSTINWTCLGVYKLPNRSPMPHLLT